MRRTGFIAAAFIFALTALFTALLRGAFAYADDEYIDPATCDHVSYTLVREPASCTERGYWYYACSLCGWYEADEDGNPADPYMVIEPTGHWSKNRIFFEATCTEPAHWHYGAYDDDPDVRSCCDYCGEENFDEYISETLADHVYYHVSGEATCEEGAVYRYECCNCDAYYEEWRDGLGHEWLTLSETKDGDKHVWATYTCSRCGTVSEPEDLGVIPLNTADQIIMWFQSYQYWLWILLGIGVMVWSIYIGVKYAMARNAEEAAKAKTLVSNYFLGLLSIAVICLALPYLVYIVCWLVV